MKFRQRTQLTTNVDDNAIGITEMYRLIVLRRPKFVMREACLQPDSSLSLFPLDTLRHLVTPPQLMPVRDACVNTYTDKTA